MLVITKEAHKRGQELHEDKIYHLAKWITIDIHNDTSLFISNTQLTHIQFN